jgi:hypothetical protein
MRARASLARTPSSGDLNRPKISSTSVQDVDIKFSKKNYEDSRISVVGAPPSTRVKKKPQ